MSDVQTRIAIEYPDDIRRDSNSSNRQTIETVVTINGNGGISEEESSDSSNCPPPPSYAETTAQRTRPEDAAQSPRTEDIRNPTLVPADIESGVARSPCHDVPEGVADIPGPPTGAARCPPPTYEEVFDPDADPPTYDSLYGRIRDTRKTSKNCMDFLFNLLILLIGTLGYTIACSISVLIPVAMISVGSLYIDECPAEPYVPVFLVIGGAASLFKYLIGVSKIRRSDLQEAAAAAVEGRERQPIQSDGRIESIQSLISCFLCGWFISGCVWVYRIYKPLMDFEYREYSNYCNRTVYTFAFWLITTAYIFLGFFTSCICCFSIIAVFLKTE